MWKVVYKKSVKKDLKHISQDIQKVIKKSIEHKLMIDPLHFGKPLRKNLDGLMKLRVRDYRIIYSIDKKVVTIYVIKIGHRKEVYKSIN